MTRIAMETPNLFNALVELEKGDGDDSSSSKSRGGRKCTLISEESLSRVEAALEVGKRLCYCSRAVSLAGRTRRACDLRRAAMQEHAQQARHAVSENLLWEKVRGRLYIEEALAKIRYCSLVCLVFASKCVCVEFEN